MRMRRLKVSAEQMSGCYHCVSRVVGRQAALTDEVRDHFVYLMREHEALCQVEVLTFCVLPDHFHLLVRVPQRPQRLPTAEEIVGRIEGLLGRRAALPLRLTLRAFRRRRDEAGERAWLAGLHVRMWDVSLFMKLLKQRFTQWYNRRNARTGTLWETRFDSVLVESSGPALQAMAAYIDLNPVRAGRVGDPKDYRWSGYGEAVTGQARAREGIRTLVMLAQRVCDISEARALEAHRAQMTPISPRAVVAHDAPASAGMAVGAGGPDRAALLRRLEAEGRLPMPEYLQCRVRYFSEGGVLGSRAFVEEIFRRHRDRFGSRRKTGARKVKGLLGPSLFTVRDLRSAVFG